MAKIFERSDMPFDLKIKTGWFDDIETIAKFGLNPTITQFTNPEDVWEEGGMYDFSTTADIISLSSSDNSDLQHVEIEGLDEDGKKVIQTIKLQGQTRVEIDTPLLRVNRMSNADTTNFSGTIYLYSGTSSSGGVPSGGSVVKATIVNGNNQTQMAIYTVPSDKIGFLARGEIGIEFSGTLFQGNESAKLSYRTRIPNEVFKVQKVVTLLTSGSSNYVDVRTFPDILPPLTDIKITVDQVSSEMGIWSAFDIALVDKSSFTQAYLERLGIES